MNDQKIYNPLTKRYVLIKGIIGKKLIKDHFANKIILKPENVLKINLLINNIQKKSNIEEFKSEDYNLIDKKYYNEIQKKWCNKDKKTPNLIPSFSKYKLTFKIISKQLINRFDFKCENLNNNMKIKFNKKNLYLNYNFNNYNYRKYNFNSKIIAKILKKNYIENIEDIIDMKWFNESLIYIESLSKKDIFTLIGYTTTEGANILNLLSNNKLTETKFNDNLLSIIDNNNTSYFPFFYQAKEYLSQVNLKNIIINNCNIDLQNNLKLMKYFNNIKTKYSVKEIIYLIININTPDNIKYILLNYITVYLSYNIFWKVVINNCQNDIERIINNSPKTYKTMYVYRGTKYDNIKEEKKLIYKIKNIWLPEEKKYKNKTLWSTSLNFNIAQNFAYSSLLRIKINKGSKVLLIQPISTYPSEIEILLNKNSNLEIKKYNFMQISNNDKNVCIEENKINISNLNLN
jgi:hypothetical protein